ncbi:MAG: radical SAM protein [Ectothiorhodospiraceae bacterium]|nr:radical SAM protein [Ectothiorhodospiraceae bacterium]
MKPQKSFRGRGTQHNPQSRFKSTEYVHEPLWSDDLEEPSPKTQFIPDNTKEIFAWNDSPDIGFDVSINPYRGCEHGCVYCYARPFHEYLDFSSGIDFETKILVKENAPALVRKGLQKKSWEPQVVAISGITDPYQPVERKLELTRGCLEVFRDFRNPIGIVTKNHLVTRDIDILSEMSEYNTAKVMISLTTLDRSLTEVMEPRTSRPERRLAAIRTLSEAGIPVGVLIAPIVPGLTDREIPELIAAAKDAGAEHVSFVMLRLPNSLVELFTTWLDEHYPDAKSKVLGRIQQMRGGNLYDSRFGVRGRGEGVYAEHIHTLFKSACKKHGIPQSGKPLSTEHFRNPYENQLSMF